MKRLIIVPLLKTPAVPLFVPLCAQEECAFLHRRDGKKGRDDDETEDDTDNLELLTVLLAWSLLLFGLFQVRALPQPRPPPPPPSLISPHQLSLTSPHQLSSPSLLILPWKEDNQTSKPATHRSLRTMRQLPGVLQLLLPLHPLCLHRCHRVS